MREAVTCPNCGGRVDLDVSQYGNLIFCLHCRESFELEQVGVEAGPEVVHALVSHEEYLSNAKLDSSFWLG
ncbi:MAG: hypothetical protein GXY33_18320 [Phycisphaerae bacterium]|nr:hypothetical protein [Phycisphaerae bacterium]